MTDSPAASVALDQPEPLQQFQLGGDGPAGVAGKGLPRARQRGDLRVDVRLVEEGQREALAAGLVHLRLAGVECITRTAHSEALIVRGTGYEVQQVHCRSPRSAAWP